MKRILTIFIISWFITFALGAQTIITRLGIINPTVRNIQKVIFFKNQGLWNFDSLQVTGYFHADDKEQIQKSRKYLEDQDISFVKIKTIKGKVSMDSLFLPNKWRSQFKDIFEATDGLIFFGGDDIPPALYGEKTFLNTDIIDRCRNWELSLMFNLLGGRQNPEVTPLLDEDPDYVVMGICLGMQIMNVATGGSLYQDIPFQIYGIQYLEKELSLPAEMQHKNYSEKITNTDENLSYIAFHPIKPAKKSFLNFPGIDTLPFVPSVHHQAVKTPGQNILISATSVDGKVVEAIENRRYKNVYGIQFHSDFPEIYASHAVFHLAPGKDFRLSKTDLQFHYALWKDFCKRLKSSKN